MAESAAQVLSNIPQDAPGVAQGLNPTTADPARQMSIKEAWSKVVAENGPVTYDQDPSDQDRNAAAQAVEEPATEATTEEENPAEEKPAPAKKAKAKEEPAPEPEEEEEEPEPAAAKETVGVRDLIKERQKLRERFERNERAQTQRFEAKQRQLQEYEQKVQGAHQQLQPVMRAAQAIEQGDFDGFAKALGEVLRNEEMKDWNTLNSEALKAVQSPIHKELRALRQKQEDDRKEAERLRNEQVQRAQFEQKQREVAEWKRGIAEELSGEEDAAIPAIVETRPELVDAIFNIQNHHYQTTNGEVLSARDAAVQLLTNVRKDFKFWSNFFEEHGESDIIKQLTGSQSAPKKKTAVSNGTQRTETSERRGAKAPKNVSQSQTAQAAALAPMSEKELKRWAVHQMEQDFNQIR